MQCRAENGEGGFYVKKLIKKNLWVFSANLDHFHSKCNGLEIPFSAFGMPVIKFNCIKAQKQFYWYYCIRKNKKKYNTHRIFIFIFFVLFLCFCCCCCCFCCFVVVVFWRGLSQKYGIVQVCNIFIKLPPLNLTQFIFMRERILLLLLEVRVHRMISQQLRRLTRY